MSSILGALFTVYVSPDFSVSRNRASINIV